MRYVSTLYTTETEIIRLKIGTYARKGKTLKHVPKKVYISTENNVSPSLTLSFLSFFDYKFADFLPPLLFLAFFLISNVFFLGGGVKSKKPPRK